jgi:hypothetical protein
VIDVAGATHHAARRVTFASAAIALADLVVGCTVFGIASLGILAAFGAAWMGLATEYAAHAMTFGTAAQYHAAAGLVLLCPIFAIEVAWLGYRSIQLPRRLWHAGQEPPSGSGAPLPIPAWTGSDAPVPMADGALWAVRGRRGPAEYRYISLLIGGG